MKHLKNIVKKITAIGLGSFMIGASILGATADLGSYPEPFVTRNTFNQNTQFVVGSNSAFSDTLSAAEISANLQASAEKQENTNEFVKEESLPINVKIQDSIQGFGTVIDHTDIQGLQDTEVTIDIDGNDNTYDVHDEIRLLKDIKTETGLTFQPSADWQDKIFIPVEKGALGYFYVFDETLETGNFITDAASEDEIEINFLGKKLSIESAKANEITLNLGERHFMNAGDTINIGDKEVTLVRSVSNNKVIISVDDQTEIVAEDETKKINGLRIKIQDVSDDDGIEFDSAIVIAGKDQENTFKDGDAYIGEDEDNPVWVWKLENLDTNNPTIGVVWNLNLDNDKENENPLYEHPIYEGESIVLPNDYARVTFTDLTISSRLKYEVSTDETEDLYFSVQNAQGNNADHVSATVMKITSNSQDRGFIADGKETEAIYLYSTGSDLELYYGDKNENDPIRFAIVTGDNTVNTDVFRLDYKDSSIPVDIKWDGASDSGNVIIHPSVGESITLYVEATGVNKDKIEYFGHSNQDTITANDVLYGAIDISGFDKNTQTPSGIIIENPDADQARDALTFSIPDDANDYKASIEISTKQVVNAADIGLDILKAEDVTLGQEHMIVVGGPCANSISAELLDVEFAGESCASGFTEGEGMIKFLETNGKTAIIVAGYTAEDTRNAAKVLASFDKYQSKFAGKNEVTVKESGGNLVVA